MSKIVLVETVSTFRHVYAVRLPDDEPNENAIDDVTWNAYLSDSSLTEVTQNHISEEVFSHHVVTEDEYLELFDHENVYLREWPREKKLEFIFDSTKKSRLHKEVDFGKPVGKEILEMKIHNESSWLKPDGISKVENMYNAKYVFESCLKTKDGGWCNMPVAIFYTEKAHPEGSNYFGLYRTDYGDLMITDGISATEPFDALQVGEDIIYSRYRHDYREFNGAMVDGGRDYFKTNMKGTPVKLKVVGDHLEVVK